MCVWPVFEGVHGEGILIQPKGKVFARVIYLPDCDTDPEKLANDAMLAYSGWLRSSFPRW